MFFHIMTIVLALTGALVWAIGIYLLARALPAAIVSAFSVSRCQLRAMRLGKRSPRWHLLPKSFFGHVWDFMGSPAGSLTIRGSNYEWRGVGDWSAYPPASSAPVKTSPSIKSEQEPLIVGAMPKRERLSPDVVESDDGSWLRHTKITMAAWAHAVANGDTNQGYAAFVVDTCLAEGEAVPVEFQKDADREDDELTRRDPSCSIAHFDASYPRENWVDEVNAEDTRVGWRVWQLHQDQADQDIEREGSEDAGKE